MITKETLKAESNVKINTAMLMYIANILRERQLVIFKSLADCVVDGDLEKAEQLDEMAMANEAVGQKVLDLIEEIIGKDDFEKFLDGEMDIDSPNFMPSTGTIN